MTLRAAPKPYRHPPATNFVSEIRPPNPPATNFASEIRPPNPPAINFESEIGTPNPPAANFVSEIHFPGFRANNQRKEAPRVKVTPRQRAQGSSSRRCRHAPACSVVVIASMSPRASVLKGHHWVEVTPCQHAQGSSLSQKHKHAERCGENMTFSHIALRAFCF